MKLTTAKQAWSRRSLNPLPQQPLMAYRKSLRILPPKQKENPVIPLRRQPLNDRIKKEIIRFRFHYNWKVPVSRDAFIESLTNHLNAKLPEYPISTDTVLNWTQRRHCWIMREYMRPRGMALYQKVIDELVGEEAANRNPTESQDSGDGEGRMEGDSIENDDEYFEEMDRRLARIESGMSLVLETLKFVLNAEPGLLGISGSLPPNARNEQSGSNGTPNRIQVCDNNVIDLTDDGAPPCSDDVVIIDDGAPPCSDDVVIIDDGIRPNPRGIRNQSCSSYIHSFIAEE